MKIIFLLVVVVSLSAAFSDSCVDDGKSLDGFCHSRELNIIKPKLDEREYDFITLENGIQLVTVSHEDSEESSAALVVEVGSFLDPDDTLGMAHFLEHMIFMGTEKYPEEGDFGAFIKSGYGSLNGWTGSESTTYYFTILSEQFEIALDKFSRFFYEPLLNKSAVSRERDAVHSEYEKYIPNDGWRKHFILKELSEPTKHLFSRFNIGNRETLSHENIREHVKEFFETFYSSNQMCLVIYGSEDTKTLQEWGRKYFSPIPNLETVKPVFEGSIFYAPNMKHKITHIIPHREIRQLNLYFPVNVSYGTYRTDSFSFLSHLMGHECKGSLYDVLKHKSYMASLSAGMGLLWEGQGHFSVSISLSKEGEKNVEEIIRDVFDYIRYLLYSMEKSELERFFNESKQLSQLSFDYQGQARPSSVALPLLSSMRMKVKPEDLLLGTNFPYIFDFEKFQRDLRMIFDVDKMITIWTSQIHDEKKEEQEEPFKIEKMMGGKYRTVDLPKVLIEDCSLDISSNYPSNTFFPPPINEFIPKNLEILTFTSDEEKEINIIPRIIYEDERIKLYYKQDTKFKRPKSIIIIRMNLPISIENAKNVVYTKVITSLVVDYLNNMTYNALLSDLSFSLSGDKKGVKLVVNGWSDTIFSLYHLVYSTFMNFSSHFNHERFKIVKEEYIRNYRNVKITDPYGYALYVSKYSLISSPVYFIDDLLFEVEIMKLEDLKNFYINKMFVLKGYRFTILIMGNSKVEEIEEEVVNSIQEKIVPEVIKVVRESDLIRSQIVRLDEKTRYSLVLESPNVNDTVNNALVYNFQIGLRNEEVDILTSLLGSFLSPAAFDQLRSSQQIGYVVHFRFLVVHNVYHAQFILQSDKYDPLEISHRVNNFLEEFELTLKTKLSEEGVLEEQIKKLKTKYLEKLKTLSEETNRNWNEIEKRTFRYQRYEEYAELIENMELTQDDVMKFYQRVFLEEERAEFQIRVFSAEKWKEWKGGKNSDDNMIVFEDLEYLKKNEDIFPEYVMY